MAHLEIRLFGPLEICLDGDPVTELRSEKALALLTYLAVESNQVHRREKLAGMLWPDYRESSARTNLRRALSDLRKALKDQQARPPYFLTTRQTIQFNSASDAWVDVAAFMSLLGTGPRSSAPVSPSQRDIDQLERAVELYQAPFLAQFSLPDSAGYEEWLLLNRERFQRVALEALHCLAEKYEKKGEVERALHHAWRQLELEPWQENAQRQLMRLLALDGRRDAALAQYESYCQELARELGTEPSQQTRVLYESIREGKWPGRTFVEADLAVRKPLRKLGACPYRGLSAFREQDAPFFYGRERFIVLLRGAVEKGSFSAVIGPSGSGKTSALQAGLLPELRDDDHWLIALCRPGEHPFRSLASSLLSPLSPETISAGTLPTAEDLAADWREGEQTLEYTAGDILDADDAASRLLLVIDQFEELYSLSLEPSQRERFLDFLLSGTDREPTYRPSPVKMLITLRADFMGEALAYRPFADLLQEGSLMLGPMNRDELQKAIVKPAEKQGAAFEQGLVDRLLEDVGEAPGSLPLLEFSLTLLWERAENGWLTHEAYTMLGGVEGALTKYAEGTFLELADEDQERVPHVLTQLVQPVEGLGDTRRIATREEIGEGNWELTRHLADKRLVVTGIDGDGNETAELAHEVLIQKWDRLRDWLAGNRAFRIWQEGLRFALRQWTSSGKDEGALLRGAPLDTAVDWLEERGDELSRLEKEYIRSSRVLHEQRKADKEAQRERQHVAERRARRLLGVLVGVFALVSLFSVFIVKFTLRQRQVTRESYSRSLTMAAREVMQDHNTRLGLSLALAANRVKDPSRESKRVLLEAAYAPGAQWGIRTSTLFGHLVSPVTALDLDPSGQTVLLGLEDGSLIHWHLGSKKELTRLEGHIAQVNDVAFGPYGLMALSCGEDGRVYMWDLSTGKAMMRLVGHSGPVRSVDISPDGQLGVSGGLSGDSIANPGRLILWNLETGKEIQRLEGHTAGVVTARFTPDGTKIVASSGDSQLYMQQDMYAEDEIESYDLALWDVSSGEVIWKRVGSEEDVITLDIHPEGTKILAGSSGGGITIWDVETGKILRTLKGHRGPVNVIAFSPDGQRALSGSRDDNLIMWDLTSGEVLVKFDVHDSDVMGLGVSPDGRSAVSVSFNGEIILLDLWDASEVGRIVSPEKKVYDVALTPDGRFILSISSDESLEMVSGRSTLRMWDLWTGRQVRDHVFSSLSPITQIAVSPDGKTALLAGQSRDVLVWDIEAWEEVGRLKGHSDSVTGIVFTPDGEHALSSSKDGNLIIWDVSDKVFDDILYRGDNPLWSLAVSPDGHRAVTDSGIGSFIFWDLENEKEIRRFVYPLTFGEQGSSDLAFLPDGKTVISCQRDGDVIEWDVETGEPVRKVGEHYSTRTRIVLSPDGRLALTSGDDGTLKLWDLEEGELVRGYEVQGSINDVALAPGGRSAFFGTSEGTIIQWRMSNPSLEELLDWIDENRYLPDLTCDEREKYQVEPLCERP